MSESKLSPLLSVRRRFVNFRKDKQEAKGIRADNRQKEMDLSKMYVDEEGG